MKSGVEVEGGGGGWQGEGAREREREDCRVLDKWMAGHRKGR